MRGVFANGRRHYSCPNQLAAMASSQPRSAYSWLLYREGLESVLERVCEDLYRSGNAMVSC